MEVQLFKATTLPDAWFQLVYVLMSGSAPCSVYEIDKGSYVGQKRLEFPFVVVQIDHPSARPLIPDIPPTLGIPAPVESMEYVENYFTQYLMNTKLESNETYRYSTWLTPGVDRVIEQLRGAPGNNQATISVGGMAPMPYESWGPERFGRQPSLTHGFFVEGIKSYDTDDFIDPATGQRDPACLRVVDFRLDQENVLHMAVYFRSWDLWGGFPANLAGLQLLKEYVGQQLEAEDGRIIASSKGLHIYDHAVEVAAQRIGQDVGRVEDFLGWIAGSP